ncbi:MAP7 domain-containing protein 1 [Poecilia latipinna]|uniref:MAP7 domain-containing protein 1 n=1 Tax=Poecilia latipinna TaxID=48699 RepID=UPI00072E5F90|nr:PREDICTED: MAP7 domain-containing protein 1-like [Poecilia latipinna]
MNGAVYISFFQGQLESVLEQVVQLAVQEISKSVGSSLNALLLETAAKEQENRRLRLQLQTREGRGSTAPEDGGSAAGGRSGKAGDERGDGGRTKPEPRGAGARGGEPAAPVTAVDTRRLEQRGRVVDQLKSVMEQVLAFALRELTKIVEASFDDLLLEITKMEAEQQQLEDKLGRSSERGGGDKSRGGGAGGRRRGSVNDSVSPSGSEDTREEPAEEPKETAPADDPEPPPAPPAPQDWVPILDKVFGQKWCSDVWPMKAQGGDGRRGDGPGPSEGGGHHGDLVSSTSVILQPSPSSPQQDPRWTPLEDMEVFSPDDDEAADSQSSAAAATATPPAPGPTPTPGPPLSPSGRRSSASMLHRLLTLPSQLLDEDDEDAAAKETLIALATNGSSDQRDDTEPTVRGEEDEEEEEEEEEGDKGRKKKRRRVWSECEECGRRFSRMSLLKAHRQTHAAGDSAAADTSSSPPPAGAASPLRCSECGKRFSSNTRLHSHVRTQHPDQS